MKGILKSFTFWFIVLAALVILGHQLGQDSKNLALIELNPLLNMIADSDGALYDFMASGPQIPCRTIAGEISMYWYIGAVVTLAIYGAVLDGLRLLIRKIKT